MREFGKLIKSAEIEPSKHSSWWRRLEDVLKTSLVFVFRRRLEDVSKTSSSRRIYSPYWYVFRRHLQYILKTSWSRPVYSSWSYVFKTSSRRLVKMSSKGLQDVFKMSPRRPQDAFKTASGYLQDVFKTFSRRTRRSRITGAPRLLFLGKFFGPPCCY